MIELQGNVPGVYYLFDHGELVYIGMGWNCLLRVAEHTRKDSEKRFTSWKYTEILDKKKRTETERRLIRHYRPKYNIHHSSCHPPKGTAKAIGMKALNVHLNAQVEAPV